MSLRLRGTPEQFAAFRALLADADWNARTIANQYGVQSLLELEDEASRSPVVPLEDDAAGVLTALFIEGTAIPLGKILSTEQWRLLTGLGLYDTNTQAATVALYPVHELFIASDRWNQPDGSGFRAADDVVYPALTTNADRFVRFLPRQRCASMLDLCGGSGIGAIVAARGFADHAVSADILPKCAVYAEFNAGLNGLANVRAVTGDLYGPVGDSGFNLIAVHPPYVPNLRPRYVFQDGGEDGEAIVQRAVAELPDHIEEGGIFFLLAMLSDRDGAPVEKRIRGWLGEASSQFSVAVFPMRSTAPEDFVARAVHTSSAPAADYRTFVQLYRKWGVEQLVYCAVYLKRIQQADTATTFRRQISSDSDPGAVLRQLEVDAVLVAPNALDVILRSPLRAAVDVILQSPHRLTPEGWEMQHYNLSTRALFSMDARVDPWMVHLTALADGKATGQEIYRQLIDEGTLPPEASVDDYARAVAALVSAGFLDLTLRKESGQHDG